MAARNGDSPGEGKHEGSTARVSAPSKALKEPSSDPGGTHHLAGLWNDLGNWVFQDESQLQTTLLLLQGKLFVESDPATSSISASPGV